MFTIDTDNNIAAQAGARASTLPVPPGGAPSPRSFELSLLT
jgi:hypothetical protein